jgi:hypothetical protein
VAIDKPAAATDLTREYQIARRVEAMIDADDADTPDRYHVEDAYWDAATEMLEAEGKGGLMRFAMVVVLKEVTTSALDTGRYRYKAFEAKNVPGVKGCKHDVDSVSLHWASVDAVNLHERLCVGKG